MPQRKRSSDSRNDVLNAKWNAWIDQSIQALERQRNNPKRFVKMERMLRFQELAKHVAKEIRKMK